MEVGCFFEMLATAYQTIQCQILKYCSLNASFLTEKATEIRTRAQIKCITSELQVTILTSILVDCLFHYTRHKLKRRSPIDQQQPYKRPEELTRWMSQTEKRRQGHVKTIRKLRKRTLAVAVNRMLFQIRVMQVKMNAWLLAPSISNAQMVYSAYTVQCKWGTFKISDSNLIARSRKLGTNCETPFSV